MKSIQFIVHPMLVAYFRALNRWLAFLTLIGLLLTSVVDAIGILIVYAHIGDTPHDIGAFLVRQAFRFVIFCGLYAIGVLALRRSFIRISVDFGNRLD